MDAVFAFFFHRNKYPQSSFECVGDFLLTPACTLLQRHNFVVLKNESTGNQCAFTYTNDSKPNWRVAAEMAASVAALPLTFVGLGFKGIGLMASREMREIYLNWQPPFQPPFGNPAKIPDNYSLEESRRAGLVQRAINSTDLMDFVTEEGCAFQLLQEFIRDPRGYMVATHDDFFGDHVRLPPYLVECSCVNNGNFNRFKNQRRTALEAQLVTDTVESFPPSEHFKLNYIGFGAGELLQDFINIGKLIEAGYRDLSIILIDPILKKEDIDDQTGERVPNPSLKQFKFLLKVAEQKGMQLQIHVFKNITDYRNTFPTEKAHCISAIDFDDYQEAFNDVILCHQVLENSGKFYLSYGTRDLCFSSKECIRNTQHRNGRRGPLYASIFDRFQKDVGLLAQKLSEKRQKVVRYAQLGTESNFEEWTRLLPELAKCGCEKIEFTPMHPPKRNYFGAPLGPNTQFTKENLEYYLKLFLPEGMDITVQLVESIEAFKAYVNDSQAKFDMVTFWGYATGDEPAAKADIRWIRQHAADSQIYYGAQIYKKGAERNPALCFEGMWRWSADFGIKYLSPPKPEHQVVVEELMGFSSGGNYCGRAT